MIIIFKIPGKRRRLAALWPLQPTRQLVKVCHRPVWVDQSCVQPAGVGAITLAAPVFTEQERGDEQITRHDAGSQLNAGSVVPSR
jgi:hypothetical protein